MSCALLIAEPEPATGGFLERHLAEDGFEVLRAEDGEAALSLAERLRPDLVLLGGELDVCRRLREGEPGRSWDRDVPVIVLGAEEADAVDRVRAFDRGADDFVARPFIYDELLARIRAVLRRVARAPGCVIEAGELVIDRSTRCVTVGGQLVPLPARQFDLLREAGEPPDARVPEGRAAEGRLGLPLDRPHAHAGLARKPPAPQARRGDRDAVRAQRLGGRLPADAAGLSSEAGKYGGNRRSIAAR